VKRALVDKSVSVAARIYIFRARNDKDTAIHGRKLRSPAAVFVWASSSLEVTEENMSRSPVIVQSLEIGHLALELEFWHLAEQGVPLADNFSQLALQPLDLGILAAD